MLDRRRFLQQAALIGTAGLIGISPLAKAASQKEKTLRLYNIHTGESLRATFWVYGGFVNEAVQEMDLLMRDHRANQALAMQRDLYLNLYALQQALNPNQPIQIISGYRSPHTNQMLRANSNGVAKRSLHMEGRALDIRFPGISCRDLQKAALLMKNGGVGYYPKSGFVHIDTGRVRQWTA
jgi:uncharacterized protein YcbK (DUF882 family)